MSEEAGEKTELPTQRRLEEAINKGQFPRSADLQTVFVLGGSVLGMMFAGLTTWQFLVKAMTSVLGNLHQVPVTFSLLPSYTITASLVVIQCAGPIVLGAMIGGLLAGGIQNRFQTAPEALNPDWERVNPVAGFTRVFSTRSLVPTGLAILKMGAIILLSYSELRSIASDPIFYTTVDVVRIAGFLAESSFKILMRIILILGGLAAMDYAYQWWRHQQDMMMTKEEVKEEAKNSEGNQQVKAERRRMGRRQSKRKMLSEVPFADVIITNPTHFAVALRYDPKSMKAPKIVAKGARLNALRIRQIAMENQVPIRENKPLARMLFKHGRVGGEVPAQLFIAVAEVLAWVYRTNPYRYYTQSGRKAA